MIVQTPHPVLTSPAKKVIKIDRKVLGIIAEMKKTLLAADNPKGVGLAATQIGIPLRIFITRPTEVSPIRVFLNPEIVWFSEEKSAIERPDDGKKSARREKKLEGCLSVNNIWGYLKRSSKVRLKYMAESGEIKEEEFSGFMATIVQHETDHINGILFTQRILEQKEKLYRIEDDKDGEETLVEIEI
jgi:peptide deformylase